MTFGAEFVTVLSKYLSRFNGRKLQSVVGVSSFCVLTLGKNNNLLLSFENSNAGISLIDDNEKKFLLEQNDFLPPIINAIKSHLLGATFISFEQINSDKVLAINFERQIGATFKTKTSLILELQPRHTNLLLVAEDGNIIEAARHFTPEDNAFRTVLPRLPYAPPPSLQGISLASWLESPSKETLQDVLGFGKGLLTFLSSFDLETAKKVLISFIKDENFVAVFLGNYVAPFPVSLLNKLLQDVVQDDFEKVLHGTFENFAIRTLEAKRKKVLVAIDKELSRRAKQQKDIETLLEETKSEKFKLWADLITSNLWQIPRGKNEISLVQYNEDGSETNVLVPLDITTSPSGTAEVYYKKYKKLRVSKERAKILLGTVRAEKSDFETQRAIAESLTTASELEILAAELGIARKMHENKGRNRQKKEEVKPYKKIEYDDAMIFVGLSAKGNRLVTFKLAIPSDTWFHAQGFPGSHVILRITTSVTQERLSELQEKCASFASVYSKAKGQAGTRVDYCARKYVTPIQGGIANVTYKNFSSIYVK